LDFPLTDGDRLYRAVFIVAVSFIIGTIDIDRLNTIS